MSVSGAQQPETPPLARDPAPIPARGRVLSPAVHEACIAVTPARRRRAAPARYTLCMTTSAVRTRTAGYTVPLLTGPRYSLIVSTEAEHREAAQRLRRRVFASEPGFTLPADSGDLDADRFDEFCDHLLVYDRGLEEPVGCYRMLTADSALDAGGYYTATEFDLTALDPHGLRAVEMGRACVEARHRSGTVLTLMWAGILKYLETTGHDHVFGCVSVPMRTGESDPIASNVRGVRDLVLSRYAHDAHRRVIPRNPVVAEGVPLDGIAPPGRAVVPPLMRGYLRLGARICGEPAHDPDFGVADFVAILGLHDADIRYLERLRRASENIVSSDTLRSATP